MKVDQQQQHVTEKHLFTITPLEIKSNSKIRCKSRKSILIKLGNKTAKCSTLKTPVQLQIDVVYSKTLQKYCPLKGIIKIYDVAEDGTEIISCVGGFQTDELLNENKNNIILSKQIGTSRLTMEINILNKKHTQHLQPNQSVLIDQQEPQSQLGSPNEIQKSNVLRNSGISLTGSSSSAHGQPTIYQRTVSSLFKFKEPSSARNLQKNQLNYQSLEVSRNQFELQHNKKELLILKKLAEEKDKKISLLSRQIDGAQLTIKNLKQTNKHLNEQNKYLRQKNDKVEANLYHQETKIDSLTSQIDNMANQLHHIDAKLSNSSLQIDELKEEISNYVEVIERYRQKYGDLKHVKNRAIQMEIKQYIRWIDLQSRDLEMSEIEDTTPSQNEHSEDKGDSLSSVIRNIEIEKVPKQQMTIIRQQLMKILHRVDQMMGK